ncbi:hypothetical protein ABGB07_34040 [Micromonosporaceae bacterium B7E4]
MTNHSRARLAQITLVAMLALAATLLKPGTADAATSGGGCGAARYATTASATISATACISFHGLSSPNTRPDAYLTFSAQYPTLWLYCGLDLFVRDLTTNRTIQYKSFNCTGVARQNAYGARFALDNFNAAVGHRYQTNVSVFGTYDGRYLASPIAYSGVLVVT